MKTIEEEWKTIEDFPDYEISNFGRCRKKSTNKILKKNKYVKFNNTAFFCYCIRTVKECKYEYKYKRCSIGRLVAESFIPNPNNYNLVEYIDGDKYNNIFTNIKWVPSTNRGFAIKKYIKPIILKDEQLKKIRERIELAIRFEKSLLEGTVNEFVYGEIKDICIEKIKKRFKSKSSDFKEELASNVLYEFIERINRGYGTISIENWIDLHIKDLYIKHLKSKKLFQFDERRM